VLRKYEVIVSLAVYLLIPGARAEDKFTALTRHIGDRLMVIVPTLALGKTIYENDSEGIPYYLYSFLVTNLGTVALQFLIPERKPNGDSMKSFPSGHASAAFSGATYVHFRYSLEEAKWLYLAASFVAFSRVQAGCHHLHDVLASAALSFLSSYLLVKNKNPSSPVYSLGYRPESGEMFFNLSWRF
jgi:membrane-associated phospholipid phosphatase